MDSSKFREYVDFDDPRVVPGERAKLLLFFVTCICKLRDDMTPKVVEQRLYDWGYEEITADQIRESFEKDEDIRPSKHRKGAFEITPVAYERLNKHLLTLLKRDGFRWCWVDHLALLIPILAVVVSVVAVIYHSKTFLTGLQNLSFLEYRNRIGFDAKTTSPIDRAKYFLYYITEIGKLRADMTPEVIRDRLYDQGYTGISAEEIRKSFLKDADIRQSTARNDAFQINPLAHEKFEKMLELQTPLSHKLTVYWLLRHVPALWWLWLGLGLISLIIGVFRLGYRLGAWGEIAKK